MFVLKNGGGGENLAVERQKWSVFVGGEGGGRV